MDEFRGYLCWNKVEAANTISTEAASPSPAVFFATHTPLRIRRRSPDGTHTETLGREVSEEDVCRDFLTRPTANGVLLMPVVGDSGTGKSHLVRWIKERTPSTERRHVIYLEKARTSLRSIVEELLREVEGAEFERLRADVLRMGTEITQHALRQRLLNYLQEALTEAHAQNPAERALAGPQRLELLIRDAVVREHLLRSGGLISRLADYLWTDRGIGSPDRQLLFTIDDLPLNLVDLNDAAAAAKRLCVLIQTRPEVQKAAIDLLNRYLDVAVMNATNMGVGRLQKAFIEIRREFGRQGKEIVLLIEDFALIQGIQRDLVESVIEVGVRDGRNVLAPIRTLLAITTGPYQHLIDTVSTRVKAATPYVYELDQQFAGGPGDVSEAASFVGRYLNAARVGRKALETSVEHAGRVPNLCEDCSFRDTCHDAFGASQEGYGLYPFNEHALKRMILARAHPDKPNSFNPRAVVGEVIRNVLVEHADAIEEGIFPGSRFREEYQETRLADYLLLSSSVRDALEEADPEDSERRITFLEFWGDAPEEVVNLHPALHSAFAIHKLADSTADEAITHRPTRSTQRKSEELDAPSKSSELPAALKRKLGHIEAWAVKGVTLEQGVARELRALIAEVVIRRCQWTDPLVPEPNADLLRKAWPSKSTIVSIDEAHGQGLNVENAPIRFARTNSNAVFFRGILAAAAGFVDGNAAHVRRLNEIGEKYQAQLQRAVLTVRNTQDEYLAVALRVSLLGGALTGRAMPTSGETDLLVAALDDGSHWTRADVGIRTDAWNRAWERHRAGRAELVCGIRDGIGIAQGATGQVRMIDAARILPVLRAVARSWDWKVPAGEPPAWAVGALTGLTRWETLLDDQIRALRDLLSQVRALLPKGETARGTLAAVTNALDAAIRAGHAPNNLGDIQCQIAAAVDYDWSEVRRLERDLEHLVSDKETEADQSATVQNMGHRAKIDETPDRRKLVSVAAAERGPHLGPILNFLVSSNIWINDKLEEAHMRQNAGGEDTLRQVDDLLARWANIASAVTP